MNNIESLVTNLENKIQKQQLLNPQVSKASVGWHIEHTLLTIRVILEALKNSKPEEYKWKFNFVRQLVLTTKKIPRGRAQSPKIVRPAENFNNETLKAHVEMVKEKLKELDQLQPDNYFKHPFFGNLNVKPTRKFLEIHTRHHLKIIDDIIASTT